MPKNLLDDLVYASPNRRSFLKTIGVATAGVTALSMAGVRSAKAQSSTSASTATDIEVFQFALNLEYLESEFYTYAQYGRGIETFGIAVSGTANGSNPTSGGTTTGGVQTNFLTSDVANIAAQIGSDERAHVVLLRDALGSQSIAKPNINLNPLGLNLATLQGFLVESRIFEDVGVSAYAGGASLLSAGAIVQLAGRILATEAEHVSTIRTLIVGYDIPTTALDGADLIPPPSGPATQTLSTYSENGLVAVRTPGEVLYLAFGSQANVSSGGFFPTGVNGAITASTSPATAANLNTLPPSS